MSTIMAAEACGCTERQAAEACGCIACCSTLLRNHPPLADPALPACHAFHSGRVIKAIYRGEVVAAKVRGWAAQLSQPAVCTALAARPLLFWSKRCTSRPRCGCALLRTLTLPAAQSLPHGPTADRPWAQSGRPAVVPPGGGQPAAAAPPPRGGLLRSQASSAALAGGLWWPGAAAASATLGRLCVVSFKHATCPMGPCAIPCTPITAPGACCELLCSNIPAHLFASWAAAWMARAASSCRSVARGVTCTARCSCSRLAAVAVFLAGTGEGGAWHWMSQKRSTTCTAWCVAGDGARMCMCKG